ncbi:MAG: hypothetical protein A2V99_02325 [Spirochaetes bacterium RBG_16_67_19]|nr:MAG: hypothetical protein A2V99_02325 [Spirochaetes bacterium RBG_16_67_19]
MEIFNVEDIRADVTLRQVDMLRFGLTIADVDAALRAGYRPVSVGSVAEGDTTFAVRYTRGVDSLQDLGKIRVTQVQDMPVTLADIAEVRIYYSVPSQTFLMDGRKGIRITASPVDGGNIRLMSRDVLKVLGEARREGVLPPDTRFNLFLDPAAYIDRSIRSVAQSAVLGAILAMLVVLLSLGVFRNTLLIGISLPASILLSFLPMFGFRISLNLISLGGLALAVGMVIDASIVVMENIHRHRADEAPIRDNRHLKDLIVRAVDQVRGPVVSSVLTSVLVFLPISFAAPLTNAILGDQSRVIVFSLLFSLVVSLTLLPLMAFLLYRVRRGGAPAPQAAGGGGLAGVSHRITGSLVAGYRRLLRAVLARRWASALLIAACFGILVFSIVLVLPLIPKEIIAPPSSDRVVIFLRSVADLEAEEVVENVIPAIDRLVHQTVGQYIEGTYAEVRGRFNRFFVNVRDARETQAVVAELQKVFVSDNRWYYNVMMWDPAQLPLPRTMDLQISVRGEDEMQAVALLERIRDQVNEAELYGWVYTDPSTSLSDQLLLKARRETINGYSGYSEGRLLELVRRILTGTTELEFDQDQSTVLVNAFYPEQDIEGRERLENFLVPMKQSTAPLKHFFDFSQATGISEIASENGEQIFRLYARMRAGTPAARRPAYEAQVRELLGTGLAVPSGYSVAFENPQAELDGAIRSLFVALGASVALIYLLLCFQFNSLRMPLVILVSVPLGFIGVIFSLYVFHSTLSLNSMLGAILLAGIVVNNAIILIDFYVKSLSRHTSKVDALVEVAGLRFRPILITSLTTIIGMLPLALGLGEGSNIVQPLGIAVSGGLFISTLLTLFVVPCILRFMDLRPREE